MNDSNWLIWAAARISQDGAAEIARVAIRTLRARLEGEEAADLDREMQGGHHLVPAMVQAIGELRSVMASMAAAGGAQRMPEVPEGTVPDAPVIRFESDLPFTILHGTLVEILGGIGTEGTLQRQSLMDGADPAAAGGLIRMREEWVGLPEAAPLWFGIYDQGGEGLLYRVSVPDPATCRALRRLAMALWQDVVRPALGQDQERPVALPIHVTDALLGGPLRAIRAEHRAQGTVLVRRDGMEVEIASGIHTGPALDVNTVRALIERAARELRGVRPLRLIPWLAAQIQQREHEDSPLMIEGGATTVAKALGEDESEGASAYRALLHVFSRVYLHTQHWTGQLYALEEERAVGRRKARIIIRPGRPLLSGRVRTLFPAGERELVPLPLELPPLGIEGRGIGNRGRFWWRVLVELRMNAMDISEGQGALLPLDALRRMADQVELDRSHVEPTLHALIEGKALSVVDRDRYEIGALFPEYREMLVQAGQREHSGQRAGEISAKKRADRWEKP